MCQVLNKPKGGALLVMEKIFQRLNHSRNGANKLVERCKINFAPLTPSPLESLFTEAAVQGGTETCAKCSTNPRVGLFW